MKLVGLSTLICALVALAFVGFAPTEDAAPEPSRLPAGGEPDFNEALARIHRLEFVASVPLPAETFHPQGLKIVDQDLYLTAVEGHVSGQGHLFHFRLDTSPVPHVARLIESRSFDAGPGGLLNHAGGMDLEGDSLLIPLAAYNPYGPARILRVPLRNFLRGGEVLAKVGDHLGAMMVEDKVAYAFNWNAKQAHRIELATGRETGVIGGDGWAYQDCKRVGERWALCSATRDAWLRESAQIRLITIDEATRKVKCLWHLPSPLVETDGRIGSGVLLSRNPIDFKVLRGASGGPQAVFYFVPQDGPDSHLMIFRGRE